MATKGTVVIGADFKEVTLQGQQIVHTFKTMESETAKLTARFTEFNSKGKGVSATLDGVLKTGQKLTAVVHNVAGRMELLGFTVEGAAVAEKRLAAEAKKAAAELEKQALAAKKLRDEAEKRIAATSAGIQAFGRGRAAVGVETQVRDTFAAPEKVSALNAFENAIQRVKRAIESGKVTVAEFNTILAAVKDNPTASMVGLSAAAQRVANDLRNLAAQNISLAEAQKKGVAASFESAAAYRKQAEEAKKLEAAQRQSRVNAAKAGVAESVLRGQFAAPTDVSKLNAFENAIKRIKTAIASGSVSMAEFNSIVQKLKADPTGAITGLSPAAKKVANDIRALSAATRALGDEGKKAGEKFTIAFAGVVRLFESQVLRAGIQALIGEFQRGANAAVEFSIKIAEIQTISQESGVSTNEWARQIRALSAEFGKSQIDVAEGAYAALSNQVAKGRETFVFLNEALQFSQATVSSTADSVNLLSSALKSFDLDTGKTEQAAASLFKTIDLGRVRANELANTYGRVALLSRSTGVSMDELNAGIATLTVQGVKAGDAITFISNLLTTILKPTDELKKSFESLGVSSGTQLIKQLGGFEGFLKFLDSEGEKGTQHIAALTGNIRSLRGALGLTGPAFEAYAENYKKITTATDNYRKAVEIVAESLGTKVKGEIEGLRNFFEEVVGTKLAETFLLFTKNIASARDTVAFFTQALVAGLTILVTYKAATLAAAAANVVAGFSFSALAVDVKALGASFATAGSLARGFVAVFAASFIIDRIKAGAGSIVAFQDSLDKAGEEITKRDRKFEKDNKKRLDKEKDIETQRSNELTKAIETRYRTIFQATSNTVKLASQAKDVQIKYLQEISDAAKISGQTYVDSIKEAVTKINAAVTEATNNIEDSKKQILGQGSKSDKAIFDFKAGYANEQQQLTLIENRIGQLRGKATSLFGQATKETVEEARRLFDEIENLETQRFTKQAEIQKRRFEATGQGATITSTDLATGKTRLDLVISTADYETRIKQISSERIKLEQDFQKDQAQVIKNKEEAAAKEKTRLREIQDLIKKAVEFTPISEETGKVAERFTKGPLGKQRSPGESAALAAAEFNKIVKDLRSKATTDELKNFTFFKDLEQQKLAVAKQVQTLILEEEAKTLQQQVENAEKSAKLMQSKAEGDVNAAKTAGVALRTELEQQLKAFEEMVVEARTKSGGGIFAPLTGLLAGSSPVNVVKEEAEIMASRESMLEAQKLIAQGKQIAAQIAQAPSLELSKEFDEVAAKLAKMVAAFVEARTSFSVPEGTTVKNIKLTGDPGDRTVGEELEAFKRRSADQRAQAEIVAEGNSKLREAREELARLNAETATQGQGLRVVAVEGGRVGVTIAQTFANAGVQVQGVTDKITALETAIKSLSKVSPFGVRPQAESQGGLIKYFDQGGLNARGTDKVHAMLTPGESVNTAASTQAFFPMFKAMNARAKYFETGGLINNNTTIGDVNVTVRGGDNSSDTLREIAKGLRRGLRRGTITLGEK